MKKNLLLALFALLSIAPAAAASKNNFKEYQLSGLGAHVMVGGDLYVGLQAQYNLDDPIRLEGRVSVMPSYLPDNVNLALNGHYLSPRWCRSSHQQSPHCGRKLRRWCTI